jgi:hypothetical protein
MNKPTDALAGPSASRGSTCIRGYKENEPCGGHSCIACGRVFYCGEKHTCTPRPERTAAGIERRQTFAERLSSGAKMLDWDNL